MKRSTSYVIKAVLFTNSMFAVTSFLPNEGAGAEGDGAEAVSGGGGGSNDAARYDLESQSSQSSSRRVARREISEKRRTIKLAPKEGR